MAVSCALPGVEKGESGRRFWIALVREMAVWVALSRAEAKGAVHPCEKKLHCLVYLFVAGGGDVESMAAVVFEGGSDVLRVNTVGRKGASLCMRGVREDAATR